MNVFRQRWSPQDILSILATAPMVVTAEVWSAPRFWSELRFDETHLWGTFNDGRDIKVSVDLGHLIANREGLFCQCAKRKPCEHIAALLLLYHREAQRFSKGNFPPPKSARHSYPPRNSQQLSAEGDRGLTRHKAQQGLAQLEQWLVNLIRQGLGEPQVRTLDFWDWIADRMLVAWMPGLSQWLRETAMVAVRGGDWVAPVLHEVGLMYLLAQTFARYDELPEAVRGDLRETIGWRISPEDDAEMVRDQWLVIGQRQRALIDQTPEQLTWLIGTETKRLALIHSLDSAEVLQSAQFEVGQAADAEFIFLPSRTPLRAILGKSHGRVPSQPCAGMRIEAAINAYGEAIASNPWLRHYPVLLDDVHIARFDKHWIVRHADGAYLPLAKHFPHKWVMYAQHGGQAIQVVGVWDGQALYPMSASRNGLMIDLNTVPKYKRDQRTLIPTL